MKRSPAAETLLREYREAAGPDTAQYDRMLSGLGERIARGELPDLAAEPPPALPSSLPGWSGRALRWLLVSVGGGALVIGAALWLHQPERRPTLTPLHSARAGAERGALAVPASGARDVAAAPAVVVEPQPVGPAQRQNADAAEIELRKHPAESAAAYAAEPRDADPTEIERRALSRSRARMGRNRAASISAPRRAGRGRARAPAGTPGARPASDEPLAPAAPTDVRSAPHWPPALSSNSLASPSSSNDLAQELALIRAAFALLNQGQPRAALKELATHAARYPHGALSESREVASILALCQAGDATLSHSRVAAFLRSSPASPYAARVRAACSQSGTR